MMHRDLKPSNIFLDSNGDVKIGDFGLAVTRIESSFSGINNRSDSPNGFIKSVAESNKSFNLESHTQNIGTPFYVSPEQIHSTESTASARYNQKVDMYSLGIILIELWVPFSTGMERIQRLRDCRLAEVILPVDLECNVAKIAKRLLCHDPKKRFTSLELLRSDLLPPMLEEELMEDAMRSVVQPEAAHYPRLISTIFRKQNELNVGVVRPKDFAFDVHSGNRSEVNYFEELNRLKKEIERVFLRHGGLEVYPPLFYLPLNTTNITNQEVYYVLDDAGQRLELPNNLTRPFARWVAQSSFKNLNLRRFGFDRVFKKVSQVAGGQPFQPCEASFDLIHSDCEDETGLLETCEVVRVAFDALFAAGLRAEQLIFKCNNLKIREKICKRVRVEHENLSRNGTGSVFEAPVTFPGPGILYKTNNNNSSGLEVFDEKLIKILTPIKNEEAPEMILHRLGLILGDDLKPTLAVMTNLLRMLMKISISPKVKVIFDPLMNGPRADLYSDDFCFVILKESEGKYHKRRGGHCDLVGCGGRYNKLLEEYKFPTARLEGKGPFAVGVSLFLDRLSSQNLNNSISINNNNNNKTSNTNNRKVLLNLIGDEANLEELKLIGELWNLGRVVIVVKKKNLNHNKFTDQIIGSNGGISLQLQIKSSGGFVKIKSKNLKEIEEVSIDEIGNRLKFIFEDLSELNPENIDEFEDNESSPDYLINNNNNSNNNNTIESFNVHYLLAYKSEKNPILREKALKAVRTLNPSKGEIIIHELPRDLLRRLLEKLNGTFSLNSLSSTLNTSSTNQNQPKNNNAEEEYREQIGRLGQVLGKLGNKMVVFFNHKDNQIDIIFNKKY